MSAEGAASASTIGEGANARHETKQTRTSQCRRVSRSSRFEPRTARDLAQFQTLQLCSASKITQHPSLFEFAFYDIDHPRAQIARTHKHLSS